MTESLKSELELAWQGQLNDLVTDLACSPNGCGWVASSAAGEVIWNAGLTESIELRAADDRSIDELAFSRDSRWLAAGGQIGQLSIWNCGDSHLAPQLIRQINVDRWIERLVWHPTQTYLAVAGGDRVKIWDILTDTEIVTWKFDRSSIFDLAWHPAGTHMAVAGYKGVQIWSPRDLQLPIQRIETDTASLKVAWDRDGNYLAAGNLDRTVTIIDWHHPDNSWTLQGCPGKIRQIAWIAGSASPCLAVASGTTVVLWLFDAQETSWNGRLLTGHEDTIAAIAVHPISPVFASAGTDGYACLWSPEGEIDQILTNPVVSSFTSVEWHPQGIYLATGSQTGSIGVWTTSA